MKCFGYAKEKTASKKLERLTSEKFIVLIKEGEFAGKYEKLVNQIA